MATAAAVPSRHISNPASRRFKAALQVPQNADSAKPVPVTIVARSAGTMEHSYWDVPCVHDFASMRVKDRIAIDYEHWEEIGYLDSFQATSEGLVCKGAIVPVATNPEDPGMTIVARAAGGVPYEASIEWDSDYLLEILPEGTIATVNGQQITGPAYIFRDWTLLAVAVCKHGQDDKTSVELQASKQITKPAESVFLRVSKSNGGNALSKINDNGTNEASKSTPAAATQASKGAEGGAVTETPKPTETPAPVAAAAPVVPGDAGATLASKQTPAGNGDRELAKAFLASFGDVQGAKYFAEGKSLDEAKSAHIAHLTSQNTELASKLSAVERGGNPVEFGGDADKREAKASKGKGLAGVIRVSKQR